MKKILLLLLTSLLCTDLLFAQTKGQILLYGTVSLSSQKSEWGQKSFWLRGAPGVGYNLSDNWAVGASGSYQFNSRVDSGAKAMKTSDGLWSAGPFIRYTQPLGELFFIYGQLDLAYGQPTAGTVNGVAGPKPNAYNISANLMPAVGMELNNGFNFYFAFGGLNYNYNKTKTIPDAAQSVTLNFGHAFQFGVSKFFGDNGRSNSYRNY